MTCMNEKQKEIFFKNMDTVLFHLSHALHREIDIFFGRQLPTPYSTSQNAYTTHIFGNVFPNTETPLAVFKQTCKDAGNIFVESDAKLADLIRFERALDVAIEHFVQKTQYDDHQINQSFFVLQNFKMNMLNNMHSSKDFLKTAKHEIGSACHQVTKKMRFMQDLEPLMGFRRDALKAFEAYMQTQFEADDLEGLKKSIQAAIDTCATCYEKTLEPSVLDYIKAVGLAVLGVLVGLATLPAVIIFSSYRESLNTTFFAGTSEKVEGYETSELIKKELKSNDLVEVVDSFSVMPFTPY